jgi:hypothetical protein
VGVPGFTPGMRRRRFRPVASALLVGNWKCVIPTSFQAMPQKPPAVEDEIKVRCPVHRMALAC